MTSENKDSQLPKGWTISTIEEIIGHGGLFSDGDWIESKDQDPNGDIRLLQLADIGDGFYKNKSNRYLTKEKFHALNCTLVKRNDVLVARMPDPLGRACIFPGDPKDCVTVVDVCIIRTGEHSINHKWLMHTINSPEFREAVENLQSGSTRKRISRKNLAKIVFPIPPLSEQKRIVDKIEELFSDLDNGIENLRALKEKVNVYRQTVLKYAFEGKLTADWRKEKADKLEPAEKLLEKIKHQRQQHYESQLEQWEKEAKNWKKKDKKGKKPTKPRKFKDLTKFTQDELEKLPILPKGWSWVKIDKVIEFSPYSIKAGPFGSELKKEYYVNHGYKIYGQEQVIRGDHKFGDYYISKEKYENLISCKVKPRDVLISLVGTVGKVLILSEDIEEGIINPRLIKISLNEDVMISEFFKYYFESVFLKSLYKNKAHGATMDILNLSIIQDLPFPICCPHEQQQIVSEIESRLSVCDKLEETIETNFKKAETLRRSILKCAFEGKLVSQDPNDEPAEILLERIKIEKQKYLEEQKKRKKIKEKKTVKKMKKEQLHILDILKNAKKPLPAKDLWLQSVHKDNIDAFYAELKQIEAQIEEIREGTVSLLRLKNEN